MMCFRCPQPDRTSCRSSRQFTIEPVHVLTAWVSHSPRPPTLRSPCPSPTAELTCHICCIPCLDPSLSRFCSPLVPSWTTFRFSQSPSDLRKLCVQVGRLAQLGFCRGGSVGRGHVQTECRGSSGGRALAAWCFLVQRQGWAVIGLMVHRGQMSL